MTTLVSRRTMLRLLVGTPMAASLQGFTTSLMAANVPVGFNGKVKGVNLTTKPSDPSLGNLWMNWDWLGWIKPQLDVAAGCGCNAVRLQGDVVKVVQGVMMQADYDTRAQQFAAYCNSLGLAVYYTGCSLVNTDGTDNGTSALTSDQMAPVMISNINAMASTRVQIIGADLVQEADGNPAIAAATANSLYALVRPNIPAQIPCTFSTYKTMPNRAWLDQIIGSCDYLDFHIYPSQYGITATVLPDPALAAYPGKDILFGEGGADSASYTEAQVTAWNAGFAALGDNANASVRGALIWAVQDQGPPGHLMGLVDSNWYVRRSTMGPWFKWCNVSFPPPPPPPPPPPGLSPDGTRVPTNATSITDAQNHVWTIGANYATMRDGVQFIGNGGPWQGTQILKWPSPSGYGIWVKGMSGNWWYYTPSGSMTKTGAADPQS